MTTNALDTLDNSAKHQPRPLPAGIYAPIPTAFKQNEEVDIQATVRHAVRLARAGVGLVVSGSTGEAIALSREERFQTVAAIRSALRQEDDERVRTTAIIAGAGGGSERESVALCQDAAKAGADAVIIITPGYFAMSIAHDRQALKQFFVDCAEASPLPVMMYNFPAAAGGIDLDSELMEEIARHPNICGAKLTCAGVGKLGRLANGVQDNRRPFHVFPGFADILFPCMMIGATGAIVGTANVIPRLCVQHFHDICAFQRAPSIELMRKIQADQDLLSRFDRMLSKGGIVATKYALERHYYAQGPPRKPLQPVNEAFAAALEQAMIPALERERELERVEGVQENVMKAASL